jgi:glutaconate CoA-transferase, subunit B
MRTSHESQVTSHASQHLWTPFSYIVINLARQIRPAEIAFSGVNSTLPMIACLLAKQAYDFHYTYINVAGGVEPQPTRVPLSSSDPDIVAGSPALFPNEDFYDLCARGGLDLVYLGCAQIDAEGRTNVSTIGPWEKPKVRLPGGGGAAVMLPTAKRVVTWRTEHSPRVLVDQLDFVTAAGNMSAIVTPLAVFERDTRPGARFRLASWNEQSSIDAIRKLTGFTFDADSAVVTPAPTSAELSALASLDPRGTFAAEVNGAVRKGN